MNIKQIKKYLCDAGIDEAEREAYMFVEHFLGLDAVMLAINPEFNSSFELEEAIKIRCNTRKPIQHILGKAYFMGEYFKVNSSTLIPRDETEILVRKAIGLIKENNFNSVLDIGTGSGCIACIIAKQTNAQVLGIDISSSALQIALDNSSKLSLFNKAIFRKSDLFSNIHADEKFDVIISNPPYIAFSEKKNLQQEVLYEPEIALFTNDINGLEFYKIITLQARNYLKNNGFLLFELGINQSEYVKEFLLENNFEDIEIIKDLAYIDRVIIGRMK